MILNVIIKEKMSSNQFPREPEPDLVMDKDENVDAYKESGKMMSGEMAANYLYHTTQICKTIKNCHTVLDLACGPATILCMVAELNPHIKFMGIDLSKPMLEEAKKLIEEKQLKNIELKHMDITNLEQFTDGSFEGVISTMALHHLPDLKHLKMCFHEIKRITVANPAIYLADFIRLKTIKSIVYFAYRDRKIDHLFALDYERSLRAAFSSNDYKKLLKEELPTNCHFYKTAPLPLMGIIKTKSFPLSYDNKKSISKLKRKLGFKSLFVYFEILIFFFLGHIK